MDAMKQMLMNASLSVKGKDTLTPEDVQLGQPGPNMEAYLLFPRKVMYTADDKEVEFSIKIGNTNVKQKFRLKDMVFNGKVEM